MTPKIEKKLLALQTKMSKKFPDVEIVYAYDLKGKPYALAFDQEKNQMVTLKNFKPIKPDLVLFDVEGNQINGPMSEGTSQTQTQEDQDNILFEAYDANNNVVSLAYNKPNQIFFDPNTGEQVDGQNYFDGDKNPLVPSMFDENAQVETTTQIDQHPVEEVQGNEVPMEGEGVAPSNQGEIPYLDAQNTYDESMNYMNQVDNSYAMNPQGFYDPVANQQMYFDSQQYQQPEQQMYNEQNVAYQGYNNQVDQTNNNVPTPIPPKNEEVNGEVVNGEVKEESLVASRITEHPLTEELEQQNKRIEEVARNLKDQVDNVNETANQMRYQVENAEAFAKEVESKVANAFLVTADNATKISQTNAEIEKVKANIASLSEINTSQIEKTNQELAKFKEELEKVRVSDDVLKTHQELEKVKEELAQFKANDGLVKTYEELERVKEELAKFKANDDTSKTTEELEKVKANMVSISETNNNEISKTNAEIKKVKDVIANTFSITETNNSEIIKTNQELAKLRQEIEQMKSNDKFAKTNEELSLVKENLVVLEREVKQVREETRAALTVTAQAQHQSVQVPRPANATLEIEDDLDFIEPMMPNYRTVKQMPMGYQPQYRSIPLPYPPMPIIVTPPSAPMRQRYFARDSRYMPQGYPRPMYQSTNFYSPKQMRPIRYAQNGDVGVSYIPTSYLDYQNLPSSPLKYGRISYPAGFVDYSGYDTF